MNVSILRGTGYYIMNYTLYHKNVFLLHIFSGYRLNQGHYAINF